MSINSLNMVELAGKTTDVPKTIELELDKTNHGSAKIIKASNKTENKSIDKEDEYVSISEDFAEVALKTKNTSKTENPYIIDEPDAEAQEVTVKPTDEQIETINSYINNIAQYYEDNNTTTVSNTIYKDADGNPTQQVIEKKNSKGEPITVTLNFDEQGRVKSVQTTKSANGRPIDGHRMSFEYLADGRIAVDEKSGFEDEETGMGVDFLVYHPRKTINKDGSVSYDNLWQSVINKFKK